MELAFRWFQRVQAGLLRLLLLFLASLSGWAGQPQTISWSSPATNAVLVWGRAYPLAATASSGLPVSFRMQEGPAFIAGGQVTATNAGVVVLVAEQAGDTNYAPVGQMRMHNQAPFAGAEKLGAWSGFPRGNALAVQVVGSLAYAAIGEGGLAIFDVRDPAAPKRLGGFDTDGSARGVQVVGTLAYVADQYAGLQVIDVSNPAAPRRLGGLDTTG